MTPRKTETSDRLSLATTAEFHQEVARLHGVTDRLRAEIERLRSQPCPYVTGNVTKYCTLTPLTLTDAEREAVETAFDAMQYAADELGLSQADCDRLVATLRGLLERFSDRPKPIATPAPSSTPAECTVPPEWTSRPYWVDPPSGHRYGFPRLYDPAKDGDLTEWMIANGYPEKLARQGLACTFTAYTDDGEK